MLVVVHLTFQISLLNSLFELKKEYCILPVVPIFFHKLHSSLHACSYSSNLLYIKIINSHRQPFQTLQYVVLYYFAGRCCYTAMSET